MREKRMGFASCIATMLKPSGGHRFIRSPAPESRPDCLRRFPQMEKCAERDQEDATVNRRIFLATCRKLPSHFPLKHLEQLIDPAGFNLAVRRRFIDHVGQQTR